MQARFMFLQLISPFLASVSSLILTFSRFCVLLTDCVSPHTCKCVALCVESTWNHVFLWHCCWIKIDISVIVFSFCSLPFSLTSFPHCSFILCLCIWWPPPHTHTTQFLSSVINSLQLNWCNRSVSPFTINALIVVIRLTGHYWFKTWK